MSSPSTDRTAAAPSDAKPRRNDAIDALRGVAILGTLASNIWIFASRHSSVPAASVAAHEHTGLDPTHLTPRSHWLSVDGALALLVECLANGKFLALLSILFGVGMCAQFESARSHGQRWPWRYYWRSALLLLDGVLHHLLVVEFDILMGYAVTAFVVAPTLALRERALPYLAAIAAMMHGFAEASRALAAVRSNGASLLGDDVTLELMTATSHSYAAQVGARWEHFWSYRTEALVIAPPLSATLFLLGAILWRNGLFVDGERSRALRLRLAVIGVTIGAPLTVLPTLELLSLRANLVLVSLQRYTVAPILAVGYLGLGLLVLERVRAGFLRARLSELGRASLSCYMLQNIACSALFYHWGMGLAPLDSIRTMLVWLVMSALLAAFSFGWFKRFRLGPFEALWKRLSEAPFRTHDKERR